MLKFKYKTPLRERANKDIKLVNRLSAPKEPNYTKHFRNLQTGEEVLFTDVDTIQYKRNKLIERFFEKYSDRNKYKLIEIVLPYSICQSTSRITQKVKKRCLKYGINFYGFIWIYDVGEKNFREHFHIVIAINPIDGFKFPDAFKIKLKKKGLNSSFVKNNKKFENYLKGKEVYERGYRKRVYGKSQVFKTFKTPTNKYNNNRLNTI